MATYNPPTQDLVIFDNSVFTDSNPTGNLTRAQADLLYLHFPFGQGAETIPSVSITGTSLLNGTVSANNNLLLGGVNGVNYLQFPNGTKQYVAAIDYLTSNNVFTGKNQFNGDVSLNAAITLNGASLSIPSVPSTSDANNILVYDIASNQVRYEPSGNLITASNNQLLASNNVWSGKNQFNSDVSLNQAITLNGASLNFTGLTSASKANQIYYDTTTNKISYSPIPAGASVIFYVAKNGSDSNVGSITSPFLTIQKAIDMTTTTSTFYVIYIASGIYTENLTISGSISVNSPKISFIGQTDDYNIKTVTINGNVLISIAADTGNTSNSPISFNNLSINATTGLPISITGQGFYLYLNNTFISTASTNTNSVCSFTPTSQLVRYYLNNTTLKNVSSAVSSLVSATAGSFYNIWNCDFTNLGASTSTISCIRLTNTATFAGFCGFNTVFENSTSSNLSPIINCTPTALTALSVSNWKNCNFNGYGTNNTTPLLIFGGALTSNLILPNFQGCYFTNYGTNNCVFIQASGFASIKTVNCNFVLNSLNIFYPYQNLAGTIATNAFEYSNNTYTNSANSSLLYTISYVTNASASLSDVNYTSKIISDISLNGSVTLASNIYATSLASTADTTAVSYNTTTKKLGYVTLSSGSALLASNNAWTGKNQFTADVSLNSITSLTSDIYATTLASTSDANAVSYNTSTKKLGYVALPAAPSTLLASNNTWAGKNQFSADVSLNSITSLTSDIYATALASTSDANAVSYNTTTKKLGYVALPPAPSSLLSSDNTWTNKNRFTSDVNFNGATYLDSADTFASGLTSTSDSNCVSFNSITKKLGFTAIPTPISPSVLLGTNNSWSGTNTFGNTVYLNSSVYGAGLSSTSDANCVSFNTSTKQFGYTGIPAAPSTLLSSNNAWTGKNQFNGDVSLNAFTTIDGSKLNIISVPSTSDAANIAVFDIASNSIKYEPSGNIINATKSNLLSSNNVWSGDNSFNNIQIASTKNINFAGTINISEAGTQRIYTSGGDLFLAPTGSVDLNGKTLNMTNGEIHNCPLIHSQNNQNIKIEGKGTGGIILTSTNVSISGDLLTVTGLSSTADTNAVSYNPTTKRLGYVALGSGSSLLTSNNQWSGTQYFGLDTSFNSDIYINNLPYSATDLSCVTYDTTTKKISFTTIPNLLPSINTWSAANTFSDTVNANNNLILGGEAFYNYLQFPDSTIQYTAAVSPYTLLASNNSWIGTNNFSLHTTLTDASLNGTIQIEGTNLTLTNLPPATTSKILYYDTGNLKVSYGSPPSILDVSNTWTAANGFMSDVSLNGANLYFGNIPNSLSDSFIAYSSSTKKISYTPSLLTSNNTYTGTNIYSNKITFLSDVSLNGANLYFGSIPSSSDANFIAYNSSTKQISYTPSLLGSTNSWSATNSFQTVFLNSQTLYLRTNTHTDYLRWVSGVGARLAGEYGGQLWTGLDIAGGAASLTWNTYEVVSPLDFTVGQPVSGSGPIAGGQGRFNCYAPSYAANTNPTEWNNTYNLFSTTTSASDLYSSAMAFCQTASSENAIICKKPDTGYTNLSICCNEFNVKVLSNYLFVRLSNENICFWYRPSGGSPFAYIAPLSVTNLMFVLYRVADNSTYGYFDATTGLWGSTSDERVKKDISPADLKLSKQFITDITPVTYRLKSDEITCKNLGFIAQDVLRCSKTISQKNIVANWEKYEEAVAKGQEPMEEWEDNNDMDAEGKPKKKLRKMMLGVSVSGMIPEIVGCIKEMNKENEELKLQISQQQKQITELQSKYELLEDSVAMLLSKM